MSEKSHLGHTEPETYSLSDPPIGASIALHARTSTKHVGPISPTTVRRDGIPTYSDNGRQNAVTSIFWGYRLSETPDEIAELVIQQFPERMRGPIRAFRDEWRDAHPPTEYRRGYNLKTAHA